MHRNVVGQQLQHRLAMLGASVCSPLTAASVAGAQVTVADAVAAAISKTAAASSAAATSSASTLSAPVPCAPNAAVAADTAAQACDQSPQYDCP